MLRRASAALMLLALTAGSGLAQQSGSAPINPQRDCQTVVTCNYKKNGSYRGCLSSYSCRACRLVASACGSSPSPSQGKCFRMRCGWGA